MDTTIERSTDIRRPRKTRRRQDVVAAVEELHGIGLKRDEIARELGMATGCRGALYVALSRAGRRDLWKAIKPADGSSFSVERTLQLAAEFLPELSADDPEDVDQRQQDLVEDIAPAGRPVRGPGGIVRWVAA